MKRDLKAVIIEDDQLFAQKLKHWLFALGYIQVEIAQDQESGMSCVADIDTDIVFIDYHLPGSYGADIIQSIRALNNQAPLILMSSDFTVEKAAHSINEGADLLLDKLNCTKGSIQRIIVAQEDKGAGKWSLRNAWQRLIRKSLNSPVSLIGVVDDDPVFALNVELQLMKCETESIVQVYSSEQEILPYLDTSNFRLLIYDYALGVGNCESLVQATVTKHPKATIIITSGQQSTEVAIRLKELGVHYYLVKSGDWRQQLQSIVLGLADE